MRILALCPDMIFRTRLSETARAVGEAIVLLRDAGSLVAEAEREPADLALLDLSAGGDAAIGAASTLRSRDLAARIVGFYSHVQKDVATRAREAGCDEVLARSRFVEILPRLLSPDK